MSERYYTTTHEWVSVDDGVATIGVTEFAQAQLGDVVYLDLPQAGKMVEAGDGLGVIESVKAASDLYSPVAGSVVDVNAALTDTPELVNRDPFGEGWLIKVRLNGDLSGSLLDEKGYQDLVQAQESR